MTTKTVKIARSSQKSFNKNKIIIIMKKQNTEIEAAYYTQLPMHFRWKF